MKHHTQIYPRNSSQWWCGGYLHTPTPGSGECLHETATAAEVCERNPTRYRSPAAATSEVEDMVKAFDAAQGADKRLAEAMRQLDKDFPCRLTGVVTDKGIVSPEEFFGHANDAAMRRAMKDICEPVTEALLREIVEMLMGCASCSKPTRCAIGDCLKAALAVRIVTDRLRHQRG